MKPVRSPLRPCHRKAGEQSRRKRGLYRYVWRMSGWHQVSICVIALFVAGLSMVPLELQKRIVNDAIGGKDFRLLAWLGGAYAAVLVLQAVLKFCLRLYQTWLSESAMLRSRRGLTAVYAERNAGQATPSGGEAISVITTEMEKLGGFVGEGISQPVVNLGIVLSILGYFFVTAPMIALMSLPFLLPQILAITWAQRTINALLETRVNLMRHVSTAIPNRRRWPQQRYNENLARQFRRLYDNRIRTVILKFAAKSLANFMNGLAPLSALVFGGYLAIQGEASLGVIVAFVSGFERVSNPLRELLSYYRVAAQAKVQHDLIADWSDAPEAAR